MELKEALCIFHLLLRFCPILFYANHWGFICIRLLPQIPVGTIIYHLSASFCHFLWNLVFSSHPALSFGCFWAVGKSFLQHQTSASRWLLYSSWMNLFSAVHGGHLTNHLSSQPWALPLAILSGRNQEARAVSARGAYRRKEMVSQSWVLIKVGGWGTQGRKQSPWSESLDRQEEVSDVGLETHLSGKTESWTLS